MRILVSGSEGFVGKNLCMQLGRSGHQVYGFDVTDELDADSVERYNHQYAYWSGSVTDLDFLRKMVEYSRPDIIIHLAAHAIVREVESSPLEGFQVNIMGTVNILEIARIFGTEVIVASSDKAYGDNKLPYTEDLPLLGCYPYDVSKACVDMLARSYPYRACVTRCSNIYGPGDLNFSRLIPYTIKCLIQGTHPQFHSGAGNVCREYTYVDDIVDAYILLAERINDVKGQAYNVGSGFKATRNKVVSKIFDLMGKPLSLELVPAGFREIRDQYLSSEKIRSLGWQPKVTFEEGLRRTIEFYRKLLS